MLQYVSLFFTNDENASTASEMTLLPRNENPYHPDLQQAPTRIQHQKTINVQLYTINSQAAQT